MATPTQEQIDRIHQPWPEHGLERVLQCPVCESEERAVMHEGLRDWVFYRAPGGWTLYRCEGCGSGYLDPRPNEQTIHLAYESYYTHENAADFGSLGLRERIRRQLANGYRNWRYGTSEHPALRLGVLAAGIWPSGRATIDAGMRHLPKASPGQRLLDIGCGNGEFLRRAKSAGWEVMGLDFDEEAVKQARSAGLDVRHGGVGALGGMEESFDTITMGHVIEHVPHPLDVLRTCFDLLKPGGVLWLDTPNINALGHQRYGRAWRGLEPPRHLVLFSVESLLGVLIRSGFENPVFPPYRPVAAFTYLASEAIAQGVDPYAQFRSPAGLRYDIRQAEIQQKENPKVREFITVKTKKPFISRTRTGN